MRLLVITQKVDIEDPVLGFFHGWVEKLSEKFEFITVICLGKGRYELPSNVKVLSLGKELKANSYKLKAILNFYKYIWQERGNYDAVFVHMNQEYVLLGFKLWKLWGKKIYMWRNHKQGSLLTRLAVLFSNKVFYTSADSFTAQFKKAVKMPVGVDIQRFKDLKMERLKNSVLSLGRISSVKNVHLFLGALKVLRERGVLFEANVYGDALPKDEDYMDSLNYKNLANFHHGVPNYKTPEIYNSHEIFVNLTPSGSFDKTILESAVCGCLSVIANTSLKGEINNKLIVGDLNPEKIADAIEYWLKANEEEKEKIRENLQNYVLENHSLNALMDGLYNVVVSNAK